MNNNSSGDDILWTLLGYFKPILSPIRESYSNELLADQINGIAIMLFLLSIITIILFVIFTFNAIILIYRERILIFFKNKYIRAYLKLNNYVLAIELIISSIIILSFLLTLSKGIQFIARHPLL